ncbi:MAG: hypothetical protein ACREFX_12725, partial [Opitutaceae bacterium]
MNIRGRQLRPGWIWLGIAILSLGCGVAGGHLAHRNLIAAQAESAAKYAASLVPGDVRGLSGHPADAAKPEYRALKERLVRLAAADPSIRTLYLVRAEADTGWTVFIADSLPEKAGAPIRPGDRLAASRAVLALQQA